MHFGFGVQNAGVVSLLSNLDLTQPFIYILYNSSNKAGLNMFLFRIKYALIKFSPYKKFY